MLRAMRCLFGGTGGGHRHPETFVGKGAYRCRGVWDEERLGDMGARIYEGQMGLGRL